MAVTACLVTGGERAAIATIEVRGPGAAKLIGTHFALATPRAFVRDEIRYGTWRGPTVQDTPSVPGESVVVIAVGPPIPAIDEAATIDEAALPLRGQRYDEWEIHCHGGELAANRILDDLQRCDVIVRTQAAWQADCGLDLLQQESIIALTRTTTAHTAGVVLDQVRGAMRDFAVWALDALEQEGPGSRSRIQSQAASILELADFGLHLTRPWIVVLAGRPNVGKSSLINALVGYERSITLDRPGTTRDILHADAVLDGWPVLLADTAGIRQHPSDDIERQGMERARIGIADADLVVWVAEASPNPIAIDDVLLEPPRRALYVANKIDLAEPLGGNPPAGWIPTAATAQRGIEALRQAIVDKLIPWLPAAAAPVPVNERQVQALRRIVAAREPTSLRQAVSELLGR